MATEPSPREARPPKGASPDGQWQAFVNDHNVHVRDLETGEAFSLSGDGSEDDGYRGRFAWSPDSKSLVAVRTRKGDEREVYFVESSPKDQLQPKLHSHDYLKPGDRIPQDRPQLFDVANRRQIAIDDDLFPNPWSITDLRWSPNSDRFTFVYNERGHQVLRVVVPSTLGTGEVAA